MLQVVLGRDGFEVVTAESIEDALDATTALEIDVAIIERTLPDGNGLDLLDRLRALPRPIETIMTSVDPGLEFTVQAGERGAFDVVSKPFGHLRLMSHKIRRAMSTALAARHREELRKKLAEHAAVIDDLNQELLNVQKSRRAAEESTAKANAELGPRLLAPEEVSARFLHETARALRYSRPLAVALARIDGFDALISRSGRQLADQALAVVGSRFITGIREVDTLGRQGRDEILLLLPETGKAAGLIVAERLRKKIAEAPLSGIGPRGTDLPVTVSFGVAALPTDTMNGQALLKRAEVALQRAKNEGQNKVYSFDPTRG
jgi:two-component system cell cycle response regulator